MKIRNAMVLVMIFFAAEILTAKEERHTPTEKLLEAAEEGNLSEVVELIGKGAEVNALDEKEGITPLIAAALGGHVEVARVLIRNKADVNLGDESNSATPLMWVATLKPDKEALEKGRTQVPPPEKKLEIARLLLAAGARVNLRNSWGGTALQWASDEGNLEMVKLLLDSKADPNISDGQGLTPLMAAVNYDGSQYHQIAEALISAGTELEARNKEGETALMYAVNPYGTENARLLIRSGANANVSDHRGITALMKACQYGRAETVKILLDAGARIDARTKDGRSVLKVAREAGFQPAIQILIRAGAKD